MRASRQARAAPGRRSTLQTYPSADGAAQSCPARLQLLLQELSSAASIWHWDAIIGETREPAGFSVVQAGVMMQCAAELQAWQPGKVPVPQSRWPLCSRQHMTETTRHHRHHWEAPLLYAASASEICCINISSCCEHNAHRKVATLARDGA